jgi:hypothetical protein
VKEIKKQWFKAMPWDRVLSVNQNLCEAQKDPQNPIVHTVREESGPKARQLWENAVSNSMTLFEAIEVCRRCCDLAPFVFNNSNTFASLAATLVEDWLNLLPSVEAQIVRNTICHYVADHIVRRRELVSVINHFAKQKTNGTKRPEVQAVPQMEQRVEARVIQA